MSSSNEITMHPDTGLPPREIAFYLAVSDRVWEHHDSYDVRRAFGRYLEDEKVDEGEGPVGVVTVDRIARGGEVAVRIVQRDDGGYSMTLAEEPAAAEPELSNEGDQNGGRND